MCSAAADRVAALSGSDFDLVLAAEVNRMPWQEAENVKSQHGRGCGVRRGLIPCILLCLAAVVTPAPQAMAQYLFNRSDFPVGSNPRGSVSADFNNDGIPDLAVVDQASNTVSVM